MTLMVVYLVLVFAWLVFKCCERPLWEHDLQAARERAERREREWNRE